MNPNREWVYPTETTRRSTIFALRTGKTTVVVLPNAISDITQAHHAKHHAYKPSAYERPIRITPKRILSLKWHPSHNHRSRNNNRIERVYGRATEAKRCSTIAILLLWCACQNDDQTVLCWWRWSAPQALLQTACARVCQYQYCCRPTSPCDAHALSIRNCCVIAHHNIPVMFNHVFVQGAAIVNWIGARYWSLKTWRPHAQQTPYPPLSNRRLFKRLWSVGECPVCLWAIVSKQEPPKIHLCILLYIYNIWTHVDCLPALGASRTATLCMCHCQVMCAWICDEWVCVCERLCSCVCLHACESSLPRPTPISCHSLPNVYRTVCLFTQNQQIHKHLTTPQTNERVGIVWHVACQ